MSCNPTHQKKWLAVKCCTSLSDTPDVWTIFISLRIRNVLHLWSFQWCAVTYEWYLYPIYYCIDILAVLYINLKFNKTMFCSNNLFISNVFIFYTNIFALFPHHTAAGVRDQWILYTLRFEALRKPLSSLFVYVLP